MAKKKQQKKAKKNPAERTPLSQGQLEIMHVVWDSDIATVAEVWQRLSGTRPMARNTVQTMMTRLEKKGRRERRVQKSGSSRTWVADGTTRGASIGSSPPGCRQMLGSTRSSGRASSSFQRQRAVLQVPRSSAQCAIVGSNAEEGMALRTVRHTLA